VQGFMLDTNIFNRIVNEQIPLALFAGRAVFATHVQRDELNATLQDEKRRQRSPLAPPSPGGAFFFTKAHAG
jgi:hypothetical protein